MIIDALTRKCTLLTILKFNLTKFDHLKNLDSTYEDFSYIRKQCLLHNKWTIITLWKDSFSRETNIVFQKTSLREFIMHDLHCGGLSTHIRRDKTIFPNIERLIGLKWRFTLLILLSNVSLLKDRGTFSKYQTLSSLLVPFTMWEDLSVNFGFDLPITQRKLILFLLSLTYFPIWHTFYLARKLVKSYVAQLFF